MSWFNCKVSYEKLIGESGKIRKVTESYLVDADDFTEVETLMGTFLIGIGPYVVESVRKIRLYELFLDDKSERYYKCKAGFITLDEKTGLEKRKREQFIVMASDFEEAVKAFVHKLDSMLVDYEIVSVQETDYVDLIR